MNLHNLSAPVPTKVARALVFVGNIMHTIGTNLLSVANEELTDELAKTQTELLNTRLDLDSARAEFKHQGAAATLAGTAAAVAVVDELEPVDELVDASSLQPARRVDDDNPEWLGFGGFPANQSGGRL